MRRTRMILGLALGLMVLTAVAGQVIAADTEPEPAAEPRVVAIKFHADWCGTCKAMGPLFSDLANKLDGEPVLFVEIDLTNKTTTRQAQYMLAALGAGDLWSAYGGKTGFIVLLDGDSRQEIGKLTKEQDFKQMVAAIKQAVGGGA